ncbi:MAG: GxxExxY protein [Saprospiraceae bacterium]|nr:GxxExxY protein [Saprospiraceae bacterium]MCB9323272.1 GxxExxY protein [Lewinellaceae bacterium]
MHENEISFGIRGAIFEVYNALGPGLLESIYEAALVKELKSRGINVVRQKPIPVFYKGEELGMGFRSDLFVEDKVIVEIKSVEQLHKVFFKILLSYLRLSDIKLGILVNFNVDKIEDGMHRMVNNL